jgi:hypothetical protein
VLEMSFRSIRQAPFIGLPQVLNPKLLDLMPP